MSAQTNYWEECISIAAEECGLTLTPEQLKYLTEAVEGSHENYGLAFYSPPSSDRISAIEDEWKAKYKALEREHEKYQRNAEEAVKEALHVHHLDNVAIGEHGRVELISGRIERIQ